jgi:hypothetical protein
MALAVLFERLGALFDLDRLFWPANSDFPIAPHGPWLQTEAFANNSPPLQGNGVGAIIRTEVGRSAKNMCKESHVIGDNLLTSDEVTCDAFLLKKGVPSGGLLVEEEGLLVRRACRYFNSIV